MTEPILFATTRVSTFRGRQPLTAATAFFFERDSRLYVVTCRHVLHDEQTGHFPDRVELVLHVDATDLTQTAVFSILLYRDGRAIWRQGKDSAGPVDVAVLELDRDNLPQGVVLRPFDPSHIQYPTPEVEMGASLRVLGFPLGFYDTRHHLPVMRHAIIASAFGVRFQGQGYFLTDARMHRGMSGAPVVLRHDDKDAEFPWRLLGVHASRVDMGDRDIQQDETLGLNCAWYADILMTLTTDNAALSEAEMGPRPATTGRGTPKRIS